MNFIYFKHKRKHSFLVIIDLTKKTVRILRTRKKKVGDLKKMKIATIRKFFLQNNTFKKVDFQYFQNKIKRKGMTGFLPVKQNNLFSEEQIIYVNKVRKPKPKPKQIPKQKKQVKINFNIFN